MSDQQTYNYKVVRQFAIMTVVWGIVGMLVGCLLLHSWHGRCSTSIYRG
jgi:cbb3-type cytochrome oxidase subunit 1